ncbi:MAG: putative Serine/threonine-protein phosphatase 2A 65 kDa regulatory subunit A beta [Streblomastix strix]|uniref:Putative Serine/threonine-protein phosphatase 2A 65 kDa regulatory subunit A beta n=1 Tax=Streblomastix strix TaxID=222440 RepID=A0A5J4WD77_9EUKA|nr:MAG: putative Serine/threonine-protein phosphatase 2A 65 kDa regulatory subunit A beta [Streblomastix strix]
MQSQLTQAAIFLENIKTGDKADHINAFKHLDLISEALGAERTAQEFLPFLYRSKCLDEDEDVLSALGSGLAKIVPFLGAAQRAHHIIPILEHLAAIEDISVRNRGVSTLAAVIPLVQPQLVERHVYRLIMRLSKGEWYTKRCSAACLIPFAYTTCTVRKQRDEMIHAFVGFCHDDHPAVRRAAVCALKSFTSVCDWSLVKAQLLPAVESLAADDCEGVRVWVAEVLSFLPQPAWTEETKNTVVRLFMQLSRDASWRVRYKTAESISSICAKKKNLGSELLNVYLEFMNDEESEIKTAAANQLSKYCQFLSNDEIVTKVIPVLKRMIQSADTQSSIKESFAVSIMKMPSALPPQLHTKHIIPCVLELLKDTQSAEVRVTALENIAQLSKPSDVESLLPAISATISSFTPNQNQNNQQNTQMNSTQTNVSATQIVPLTPLQFAAEPQWRDRVRVAACLPQIARVSLLPVALEWIRDQTVVVRETAAIGCFRALGNIYGKQWVQRSILPFVLSMARSPKNWVWRQASAGALLALEGILGEDVLRSSILSSIAVLSKDKVPNVRLAAARTLRVLLIADKEKEKEKDANTINMQQGQLPSIFSSISISPQTKREVKNILEKMAQDRDNEVKSIALLTLRET